MKKAKKGVSKDFIEKSAEDTARYYIRKAATGEYDGRIWQNIRDDVVEDLMISSSVSDGGMFNDDDVRLAIGRALVRAF